MTQQELKEFMRGYLECSTPQYETLRTETTVCEAYGGCSGWPVASTRAK